MKRPMSTRPFLVLDVESVGLHGEAYAVGYVALRPDGTPGREGLAWVDPRSVCGSDDGRRWVAENAHPSRWSAPAAEAPSPRALRAWFWELWTSQPWLLVADCPWPVESRFLAACVDESPLERRTRGPCPLIDVASVRLAAGLDPLDGAPRLANELPIHNPLADARQSARLLVEALLKTGALA